MPIKNKNSYIRCKWCRFVREDASISDFDWIGYECGNPESEYYKSLLNVDPQGNKLTNLTWSGCRFGERRYSYCCTTDTITGPNTNASHSFSLSTSIRLSPIK